MLRITCFGGVREIGGNKFLLEDSGSALMLDFGKSFGAIGNYFDEFLQPRTNSCLRDLLTLKILPAIPGIYRRDLLTHGGAWEAITQNGAIPESARSLFETEIECYDDYFDRHGPKLDGVLLSHGHTDHCQCLCFVDRRIPVYCTSATLAILQAAQEIGRGNFESDICECPTRMISYGGKSSTFSGELKIDKDKSDCARDIRVISPNQPFQVGRFTVEAVPVDHSVPGACSYIIIAPSGKTVFYTGDIRFHGRFSMPPQDLTSALRKRTAGLRPDVILTEGTQIKGRGGDDESGVERGLQEVIGGCRGLAIVDFGWKDSTRFETILNATKAQGRILAVSPKIAYLWGRLHESDPDNFPDLAKNESVKVYFKRTDSMTYSLSDYGNYKHLLGTCTDWGDRSQEMRVAWNAQDEEYLASRLCHYYGGVRAYDIASEPQKYVLHAGYFDMNELFDISPPEGSVFVRAATEPFCDDMVQDEKKLANWLKFFGVNDGRDEKIIRHHVSGHASGEDLLQFIADMQPAMVVPIHTEDPEVFDQQLGDKIDVVIPELEKEIVID